MGAGASAESKDIAGSLAYQIWIDLEYSDGYSIPNLNRKATFQWLSWLSWSLFWLYSTVQYLAITGCKFKSVGSTPHPQVPHVAMRIVL